MTAKLLKLTEQLENYKKVFGRNITCEVYRADGGILSISRLVDHFHDITLSMLIDPSKLVITEVSAKMDKVPYKICHETALDMKKLQGIFILHPAVSREVRRVIKRKEGCTHLFELIEFTFQTLFTGGPRAGLNGEQIMKIDKDLHPEEHRRLQMKNPRLVNTCRAFIPENSNNND